MSDAMTAMRERRSIRKYKSDMIPRETLDQIIEAGLYAASGRNKQAGLIIAVTNRELRDRLSRMNAEIMGAPEGTDPFYGAPVVLVVLADREVGTYVYDGSLVMGNLMLAAHELGVGSCWIHRANQMFESEEGQQILRDLGVEGDYEGIGNCVLGYADCDLPSAAPRRGGNVFYAE
ncbi:MAG: nitroreductase [Clostridia bacterium]|nr:nitroreductase [Clostridia bacterium]